MPHRIPEAEASVGPARRRRVTRADCGQNCQLASLIAHSHIRQSHTSLNVEPNQTIKEGCIDRSKATCRPRKACRRRASAGTYCQTDHERRAQAHKNIECTSSKICASRILLSSFRCRMSRILLGSAKLFKTESVRLARRSSDPKLA